MEENVWKEIEILHQKFNKLAIGQTIDYDKYYLYSLIAHSTAIEGSTLTEQETQLLFDEGVTASGKPLTFHLMNEDLRKAYIFAKQKATQKPNESITPLFLQTLNALVMHSTGGLQSVMAGEFDSSKGDWRLCAVSAGVGGKSYMNYQKVPAKVGELCQLIAEKIPQCQTMQQQYELSFNAHLNLVTIHPWVDGNGRTCRLLMNYIQFVYGLFAVKIFKEDRAQYILALQQAQDSQSNTPFLDFMSKQLLKSLSLEIDKFTASNNKNITLMF